MRVKLLAALVIASLLSASPSAMTQEGDLDSGLIDSAGRRFESAGRSSSELVVLDAHVAAFDNYRLASAAIGLWLDESTTDAAGRWRYDTTESRPIAIERVADETQALIGTAISKEDSTETFEVAFVVVREGGLLYLFIGWSAYTGVEDRILLIASRLLGLEPLEFDAVPGIPYRIGGIWDELPRIEHLPQGLTWVEDFIPCNGIYGSSLCAASAASPDPTVTSPPTSSSQSATYPPLTFTLVITVAERYLQDSSTCETKGFYSGVRPGGYVFISNSATTNVLFSAMLSRGLAVNDGCSWKLAVLGIEGTERYHVTLGSKHLVWFDYDDLVGLAEVEIVLGD